MSPIILKPNSAQHTSYCDEAGANFNGIQEVFGDQGVRKTKSCQFHFKQSLQRILLKFPPELGDLRNEFEELMTTLLTVTTLREYRDLKVRIQQISAVLPSIGQLQNGGLQEDTTYFPYSGDTVFLQST